MKKIVSRALALMLCLVMLAGMMPAALAQDLGSREEIEQLLFDVVLEKFPASTPEEQFIYTSYYEQQNEQARVDTLLATLSAEQMVAYVNYAVENGKHTASCSDECNYAECNCICHKVARFAMDMQSLIDALAELDMTEAKKFILDLRQQELHDYFISTGLIAENALSPEVTVGMAEYEAALNNRVVKRSAAVISAESTEDSKGTEAQDTLAKYTKLLDENNQSADGGVAADLQNVFVANTKAEDSYTEIYSERNELDNYLEKSEASTFSTLKTLRSAVTANVEDLVEDANTGMKRVSSTQDSNITLKLFNYSKESLEKNERPALSFSPNTYYGDMVDGKDNSVEGRFSFFYYTVRKLQNGYPVVKSNIYPFRSYSLNYLFDGSGAHTSYTYTNNTGLFKRSGNYLEYDSKYNAAYVNPVTKKIELYSNPVMPAYTAKGNPNDVQAGNFLPFNDPTQSTTDTAFGKTGDKDRYVLTGAPDLWFGMSVEFDLYMPKDGKVDGKEMVFEFRGDDDVWVFIDDVLVLDISGIHGDLAGTIDFSTGKVHSDKTHGSEPDNGTTLKKLYEDAGVSTGNFNGDTYSDYSKHNFKFFYLERGANISYCKLRFNIPTLPTGGLVVQKKIDGELTEHASNTEYTFEINMVKDANGKTVTNDQGVYEYTVSGSSETLTTENGQFKLKPNQYANFTKLASNCTYEISEIGHTYTASNGWEIDGGDLKEGQTAQLVVKPDATSAAQYVCMNTQNKTSLKVLKRLPSNTVADAKQKFNFTATITDPVISPTFVFDQVKHTTPEGSQEYTIIEDGRTISFALAADEYLEINNLPIGIKLQIEEVGTSNVNAPLEHYGTKITWNKLVTTSTESEGIEGVSGEFVLDYDGTNTPTITFTNTRLIGLLTITKNQPANEELDNQQTGDQTYLFTVTGPNGYEAQVVLKGGESLTIDHLVCGNYTVTEDQNWSWRYQATAVTLSDEITATENAAVTFTNKRTKTLWLDGSDYANNQFDGSVSDLENN